MTVDTAEKTQAARPASVEHLSFTHTVGGRAETSADSFEVLNPATGQVLTRCPDASRELFARSVTAARSAFTAWSETSFAERAAYLGRFAAAIARHQDELAYVLTCEQGKPLAAARQEIERTHLMIAGLTAIRIEEEVLRESAAGRVVLRYRPLGVVGAITPWNVPIGLATSKIVQALYTGNTIVLKPSPYTPLSTLMLGELAREILPAGVLNVLAGGNELGRWISEHPDIDKISFTGSVATGKRVMASAAGSLKRLTLELGGNDPAIVLGDVDAQAIAPAIFWAAFGNSGQVCMAIKRLYVHESRYEAMCQALTNIARTVRVGDGLDPTSELGPLQNKMQYERVLELLEDTKRSDARFLCGGGAIDGPGYFVEPTLVADIAEGTRLVDEEPFGPVLPILKFSTTDEAVERANHSRFGLGASVWTNDLALGAQIARRLESGTVWINEHKGTDPLVPFGGAKESGMGCEYSAIGLKGYMQAQVLKLSV